MIPLAIDSPKTAAHPGQAQDGTASLGQTGGAQAAKPDFATDMAAAQATGPDAGRDHPATATRTDGQAPADGQGAGSEMGDTPLPETLARLLAAPAQGAAGQAEAGATALPDAAPPATESAETMAAPDGAAPGDPAGPGRALPRVIDGTDATAPAPVPLAGDTPPAAEAPAATPGEADATPETTDPMLPDAAGQPPQPPEDGPGPAPMPGAQTPLTAAPQAAAMAQDAADPDPVQAATATPLIVVTDAMAKDARAQRGDAAPVAPPAKGNGAATLTPSRTGVPAQAPARAEPGPKAAGPDLRAQAADPGLDPKPGPVAMPKADLPPTLIDAPAARPDPAPPVTLSILQASGTPGQAMGQPATFSGPTLATLQQDWPRDLAATLTETATLRRLGAGEMLEIRLDPETLGPVTVRLDLRDGTANVSIVTQTPEAARLFTDTQQRLADAMARAGLELGSHSAGTGDGRGGARPDDARGQPGRGGPAPHDAQTDTPTQTLTLARSGPGRRIDLFA